MSQSKIEDIFFYRKKDFQENSKLWIQPLFASTFFLKKKPEDLNFFWDNIKDREVKAANERGEKLTEEEFITNQCDQLKEITMDNLAMDLNTHHKEGYLKIYDKNHPEVYALIDYRDSKQNELRGKVLMDLLEEYKQKDELKNKSVYEVLTNVLADHHHPTLMYPFSKIKVDDRAQNVIFKTVDSFIANPNREMFEFTTKTQEAYNQAMAKFSEKNSLFLATIDQHNTQDLKNKLRQGEFQQKQFAQPRTKAIEKLLNHRDTLFKETPIEGVNIKDTLKANQCRFSEELIQALYTNEPQKNQSFKKYMEHCIKKAESNLTKEEVKSWRKGPLLDIVHDIKKNKGTEDVIQAAETNLTKQETKPWQKGEIKPSQSEEKTIKIGSSRTPKEEVVQAEKTNLAKEEAKTWKKGEIKTPQSQEMPRKIGSYRTPQSNIDKDFDEMLNTLQKAQANFSKEKTSKVSKQSDINENFAEMKASLKKAEEGFSNIKESWKEGTINKVNDMKDRLRNIVMGGKTNKEKAELEEKTADKDTSYKP
jgi:hypothetical protein